MALKLPALLDGAMGTMLQKCGLKPGEIPEIKNITDPEMIRKVQRSYVEAGSEAIYANTFGANRAKLQKTGYTPEEVIRAGIRIAREAAEGTDVLVGLDVGSLGVMLEPLGTLSFDAAYEMFAEVMRAGEKAGAGFCV